MEGSMVSSSIGNSLEGGGGGVGGQTINTVNMICVRAAPVHL